MVCLLESQPRCINTPWLSILLKSFQWSVMGAIIMLSSFFSSTNFLPLLNVLPLFKKAVVTLINTYLFMYSFMHFSTVPCSSPLVYSLFLHPSPPPAFCSPKRSSPPHSRYLPGDGGQHETGGQRSNHRDQQR